MGMTTRALYDEPNPAKPEYITGNTGAVEQVHNPTKSNYATHGSETNSLSVEEVSNIPSSEVRSVDPERYIEFVSEVTSAESTEFASLLMKMTQLELDGANVPKLLTAAVGLCAESGEFTEIVKKIAFQGKPYNEENIFHMKRELGDILWYIAQACMALDTGFDELMEMNVDKLKARYPGGEFDVHYSENRKQGDL
jgi:NTP pyrophosphatase (non-canonical NTP hydrolase)